MARRSAPPAWFLRSARGRAGARRRAGTGSPPPAGGSPGPRSPGSRRDRASRSCELLPEARPERGGLEPLRGEGERHEPAALVEVAPHLGDALIAVGGEEQRALDLVRAQPRREAGAVGT